MRPPKHPLIIILKEERRKLKLPQLEMAHSLNMSREGFTLWESQSRTPNFLAFIDWCNILGYDVELKKRIG